MLNLDEFRAESSFSCIQYDQQLWCNCSKTHTRDYKKKENGWRSATPLQSVDK